MMDHTVTPETEEPPPKRPREGDTGGDLVEGPRWVRGPSGVPVVGTEPPSPGVTAWSVEGTSGHPLVFTGPLAARRYTAPIWRWYRRSEGEGASRKGSQALGFEFADRGGPDPPESGEEVAPLPVFSIEVPSRAQPGRTFREYFVASWDCFLAEYLDRMNPETRVIYELIRTDYPVHLYLDVEYERALNPIGDGEGGIAVVLEEIRVGLEAAYGVTDIEVVTLEASSAVKFSRHITLRLDGGRTMFASVFALGGFLRAGETHLEGRNGGRDPAISPCGGWGKGRGEGTDSKTVTSIVDPLVYTRNRNWRTYGSAKGPKGRALYTPAERAAICAAAGPGTDWPPDGAAPSGGLDRTTLLKALVTYYPPEAPPTRFLVHADREAVRSRAAHRLAAALGGTTQKSKRSGGDAGSASRDVPPEADDLMEVLQARLYEPPYVVTKEDVGYKIWEVKWVPASFEIRLSTRSGRCDRRAPTDEAHGSNHIFFMFDLVREACVMCFHHESGR